MFNLLKSVGACLPTYLYAPNVSLYGPCHKGSSSRFRWGGKQCPSSYEDLLLSNLGLVILFLSYAHGIGPLAQTLNAEIYSTWSRSTGMAISMAVRWILAILLTVTFYSAKHVVELSSKLITEHVHVSEKCPIIYEINASLLMNEKQLIFKKRSALILKT